MIWAAGEDLAEPHLHAGNWIVASVRLACLAFALVFLVAGMLLARLIERPFVGRRRALSSWFPKGFSQVALALMGLRLHLHGQPMGQAGAVVANHSSWLDIFVLNARKRVFFVSKAEVARWPGIGFLARSAGTLFIRRDKREARTQITQFEQRLRAGHRLLFFPEGTSTDSRRVLPFKSTLFAAFFTPELRDITWVQPVSVAYHAPKGAPARYYGWWGDMAFGRSFLKVMGTLRQGHVTLVYHPPVRVADFPDRKALTQHCDRQVRAGLADALGITLAQAGAIDFANDAP